MSTNGAIATTLGGDTLIKCWLCHKYSLIPDLKSRKRYPIKVTEIVKCRKKYCRMWNVV